MKRDYGDEIAVLKRMQERLRSLRGRMCASTDKDDVRYHAFSSAVSHLNRVIGDLQAEDAADGLRWP